MRGGSNPKRRDSLIPRGGSFRRRARGDARRFPAFRGFRERRRSFRTLSKIERFHHKFAVATIEEQLANLCDLAFDDGRVRAYGLFTTKDRPRVKFAVAGVELHTNVGSDHRTQQGNVLCAVHAKEDKHERIGLAASGNYATEKQCDPANKSSLHCCCQMFGIASVAECHIGFYGRAEDDTGSGAVLTLVGFDNNGPTIASTKRSGIEKTLRTSGGISASGDANGAKNIQENRGFIIVNGVERTLVRCRV